VVAGEGHPGAGLYRIDRFWKEVEEVLCDDEPFPGRGKGHTVGGLDASADPRSPGGHGRGFADMGGDPGLDERTLEGGWQILPRLPELVAELDGRLRHAEEEEVPVATAL
jgi:hypothetical protein